FAYSVGEVVEAGTRRHVAYRAGARTGPSTQPGRRNDRRVAHWRAVAGLTVIYTAEDQVSPRTIGTRKAYDRTCRGALEPKSLRRPSYRARFETEHRFA